MPILCFIKYGEVVLDVHNRGQKSLGQLSYIMQRIICVKQLKFQKSAAILLKNALLK